MRRLKICEFTFALFLCLSLAMFSAAGAANDQWQPRPVPLGVSGGNVNDASRLYCCSGTLGALVQDLLGVQYVLSNNHVLAKTNKGTIGDLIIQPGLIDQEGACYKDFNDGVANLSKYVPIVFKNGTNRVDAAIARVRSGQVDPLGTILSIGEISSAVVVPAPGMAVKKSGRTTGLTTGTVTAVDVTVNVTYNKTCGIGNQTAKFIGQIMIGNAGFSAGGDSGSLIVEDCASYPGAVGLLFAGSNTVTMANPIGNVLFSLGVSMVGGTSHCPAGTETAADIAGGEQLTAQSAHEPGETALEHARNVKARSEEALLTIEGVVGVGIGLSDTVPGQVVIEVYVKRPVHEIRGRIPETLNGIPVKIVETGEIVAY